MSRDPLNLRWHGKEIIREALERLEGSQFHIKTSARRTGRIRINGQLVNKGKK